MGNFYTNITLRGASHDRITRLLSAWGERAYVSPMLNECIVVYPASTESQDVGLLNALAARLSTEASCPALAVLNHDDDVLAYWLFVRGRLLDSYDSSPGYFGDLDEEEMEDEEDDFEQDDSEEDDFGDDDFDEQDMGDTPEGGDAVVLCSAFGVRDSAISEVEEVLRTRQSWDEAIGYLFASDRHADLVSALGLPECAVGFGYTYLDSGETPEDIDPSALTHIDGE